MLDAVFEIDRDFYQNIFCVEWEQNRCDPHFHSNIEIVHVMQGELQSVINGVPKLLSAGCTCVTNSYDIHHYSTPEYSKVRLLIIPTDVVKSFSALSQTMNFSSPYLEPCEETKEINYALEKLLPFNNTHDSLIAKGYLYVILGILIKKIGLTDRSVKSSSESLMRNILVYLERNYLEHITIDSLAKHFGYNKDYLSRLFNANLNCGFNQYVNVLRSRHAAALIQNTKSNLMEIGYLSGFGSSRTFTRAFKDFYKITPLEYKQRCSQEPIQSSNQPYG